jgi:hypothetical protein
MANCGEGLLGLNDTAIRTCITSPPRKGDNYSIVVVVVVSHLHF